MRFSASHATLRNASSNSGGADGQQGDRGVSADAGVLVGHRERLQLRHRLGRHRRRTTRACRPGSRGRGRRCAGPGGPDRRAAARWRRSARMSGTWSRSEMHHHRTRGCGSDRPSTNAANAASVSVPPAGPWRSSRRRARAAPRGWRRRRPGTAGPAPAPGHGRKARPEPSGWRANWPSDTQRGVAQAAQGGAPRAGVGIDWLN